MSHSYYYSSLIPYSINNAIHRYCISLTALSVNSSNILQHTVQGILGEHGLPNVILYLHLSFTLCHHYLLYSAFPYHAFYVGPYQPSPKRASILFTSCKNTPFLSPYHHQLSANEEQGLGKNGAYLLKKIQLTESNLIIRISPYDYLFIYFFSKRKDDVYYQLYFLMLIIIITNVLYYS